MELSSDSTAALVATFLRRRGVKHIFGLCGGHIMPIWMQAHAAGIRIIDARDERAAVHMAHAHAEVTGTLGVAIVTAGPGVTNAMTAIANTHVARAPVLVLGGTVPQPQVNRGALQDIDHVGLVTAITRYARTVREPGLALQELDAAVAHAMGDGGDPGPAYIEFPTDVLRRDVPRALRRDEFFAPPSQPIMHPDPVAVAAAVDLIWKAKRPLVISGRGARGAEAELVTFLDRLGAAYLDTGESRGLVPDDHLAVVAAMRGTAMSEADVVITIGRRLDFQLAYGSPAIFGNAQFVRIADTLSELRDNRRGAIELLATPATALSALVAAAGKRTSSVDPEWIGQLRSAHRARAEKLRQTMMNATPDKDGRLHPYRVLGAIQERLDRNAIVVTDGGDFLSFGRVALSSRTMLDPGPFGCIGVGVPFGIAAALACPNRRVVVATGDGAFGFNAIEIDTAVRHQAPVVIVVANNGAWQIEVHDQTQSYGEVVGTRLQFSDYAAMARGFGMHGERVETETDLAGAMDRAFANAPALVDVIVTSDAVSSDAKSGLAWVPDLQPLASWDDAERAWRAR